MLTFFQGYNNLIKGILDCITQVQKKMTYKPMLKLWFIYNIYFTLYVY